jgi:hypothetical protein
MVRLVGLVGVFEPQADPAARPAARTTGAVRFSREPGTAVEPIQLTCHLLVRVARPATGYETVNPGL